MKCGCRAFQGRNHHCPDCPLYDVEKLPYLFYYEEAVDAWVPTPWDTDNIIDVERFNEDKEELDISFKRIDMTSKELDNLPEA